MAQEIIEVPLTGKIVSVYVKEGDDVNEGDVVCTIESMKMENPILAPIAGKVIKLDVSPDQVVNPGENIATIES